MWRVVRTPGLVVACVLITACAEPPHKEMHQAQGAIDAARAAGAAEFAADEFRAAVDALERSEEAVTQNDYRLALSLAIDSRERAQTAAKAAVDARARARGEAERLAAEANMRLRQAQERLAGPGATRFPRRLLDDTKRTLAAADKNMQEARAALGRDDYAGAIKLADAVSADVQRAVETLEQEPAPPAPRKRR